MSLPCLMLAAVFTLQALAAQTKLACIGDSITEGVGLSSTENYPARLQRLLGATNEFLVRNFGLSGRTLLKRGDYPYWNETAFSNSRNFEPDIVIIQLGTNDSKPQNWRYGTNFLSDYKAMIASYGSLPSAPRIYLCTPCPVYGAGAYDIDPGVVRTKIAPAVRELAAELSLPLIDLHVRMTNASWFPDTVHPNTQGMAAMAAVMFEAVVGVTPSEEPPLLLMERTSATRIILTWPATFAGLVPRATTSLSAPNWTVLPAVPFKNGEVIRQTNNLPIALQRFFHLARP